MQKYEDISPEMRAEVREKFNSGSAIVELCRHYELHSRTVRKIIGIIHDKRISERRTSVTEAKRHIALKAHGERIEKLVNDTKVGDLVQVFYNSKRTPISQGKVVAKYPHIITIRNLQNMRIENIGLSELYSRMIVLRPLNLQTNEI